MIDCTSLKKGASLKTTQTNRHEDKHKLPRLDVLWDLDAIWFLVKGFKCMRRTKANCSKSIRKGWRDNYFIIVCFKCVKAYWLSSKHNLKMLCVLAGTSDSGFETMCYCWGGGGGGLILCLDYNDVQEALANQLTETNVTSHITWVFTQTQFMSEMFLSLWVKKA